VRGDAIPRVLVATGIQGAIIGGYDPRPPTLQRALRAPGDRHRPTIEGLR
jgi:hypothetical protein